MDQEQKNRIQAAAWGQEHVRDGSVVVVITGDLRAHEKTDRFLRDALASVREQLVVVGKGTKPAWPRLGLLQLEELVSVNQFGNQSITGDVEA